MEKADALEGYAGSAAELVPLYEALGTPDVLGPMQELLPLRPALILDVGAGTGRDAAFLAKKGHSVVAVEPVEAFRQAGMALHPLDRIRWVDDRLPALSRVRGEASRYDLILVVGVWQHLPATDHEPAIKVLSGLLAADGRLMISLRHGPGGPGRPCFPADPDRIIAFAEDEGMRLQSRHHCKSIQQGNRDLGVTWTWLCFDRG